MERIRQEPLKWWLIIGGGAAIVCLVLIGLWGGSSSGQKRADLEADAARQRQDGGSSVSARSSSEDSESMSGRSESYRGESKNAFAFWKSQALRMPVLQSGLNLSEDTRYAQASSGSSQANRRDRKSHGTSAQNDKSSPKPPKDTEPSSGQKSAPQKRPAPSKRGSQADKATEKEGSDSDLMQLSFKKAKIDDVVQWLAKTTGKSIIKHPKVKCELTIISSKKLPKSEALDLVYRALSLEGYNTVVSERAIVIVPEGEEIKMRPELVEKTQKKTPDGRQRVMEVFRLEHVEAAKVKEKIQGVLSDKVQIEADEHANKLIVTDYAKNIDLLEKLIKELDVVSVEDQVVEIFDLKHAEADELSKLVGSIIGGESSSSSSGSSQGPDRGRSRGGGQSSSNGNSGSVRLWPDPTANRIVAKAPKARISEVQELIATLDVAEPADVAVRVVPLDNVKAGELVDEIKPLYEQMSGTSLKERIEIVANSRSNSLIVLSNKEHFESIKSLVESLDTEQAQQKIVKAFALENADAQDVADQLETLYETQQGGGRYADYYFFGSSRPEEKQLTVVADQRRNTVIVQAAPTAIKGIKEIVDQLDEPVSDESLTPAIYPLEYVSAVDVEKVLKEIFNQQEEERSYFSYYYSSRQSDQDNIGRLAGKVRITSEPNRNAIIVTSNSQENLDAVESILNQLDVPSQAGESTLRVRLSFADAINVANRLNVLFAEGGSPPMRQDRDRQNRDRNQDSQQDDDSTQANFRLKKEVSERTYYPWLGGQQSNRRTADGQTIERPVTELIGRVRCVPEPRSNSIMISSSVHFLPQVIDLVKEMDTPTPQVMIEARIIEVAADFRERLGVRFSSQGDRVFDEDDFDNSVQGSSAIDFEDVFAGSPAANALRTGVLNADVNLDVLLQFLRKNTDSKILAKPQINVADNEMGRLFVGAQVPFIEQSRLLDTGSRDETFSYKDVGVILEVTPHIHNGDDVNLKIRAESSNIRSGETLFGAFILDTRNFRTDLTVKSGATIVLGGIIQREEVETTRKIPLLGDIPGIGWAFKKKDTKTRKNELMVFLRPKVSRTPKEAKALKDQIYSQTENIKKWENRIKDDKSMLKAWQEKMQQSEEEDAASSQSTSKTQQNPKDEKKQEKEQK